MKFVIALILTLLPFGGVAAADCSELLKPQLNSVLEVVASEAFEQDFQKFFASDRFRSAMKQSNSGFGLSIPLEGNPIEFGGANESREAWTLWEKHRHSTKWDFSRVTRSGLRMSTASRQAIEAYIECVRIQDSHLRLQLDAKADGVRVTLRYIGPIAHPVSITSVTAHGATVPASYSFPISVDRQESLFLPYLSEATEVTVVVATKVGTIVETQSRQPREFLVSWTKSKSSWVTDQPLVKTFVTVDLCHVRSNDDDPVRGKTYRSSPGCGKWKAQKISEVLSAGKNRRFVGKPKLKRVGGPASHHSVDCKILSGSSAEFSLLAWTKPITYTLTIPRQRRATVQLVEEKPVPLIGNVAIVELPSGVTSPKVLLSREGSTKEFPLTKSGLEGVANVQVEPLPGTTRYILVFE